MRKSIAMAVIVIIILSLAAFIGGALAPVHEAAASEAPAEAKESPAMPQSWAFSKFLWATVALVFSVVGTSWAQSRIGVAGAGAMAEKPELAGTFIILVAIPETMVILGFVIAAIILFA